MITKFRVKAIMSILIWVITLAIFAERCFAVGNDDEIDFVKIDEYVVSQMEQTHIPGLSIGIVKGDKLLYTKGYGNADKGKVVTTQTPFEIGSVSKSFTALAVMQLVEKGKIDLDSPIDNYLNWFKAYYANKPAIITVRQLLNQNSGVPTFHDNDAGEDVSIEQVAKEYLNNKKLVSAPGTKFLYSNANYNILGELVQVVSGQTYMEYMEQNIFVPLKMKHSYVTKEEAVENDLAAGYRTFFGIPVKADLPYFKGNVPSGHIFSCAEDMTHYMSIFVNGGKYEDISILSSEGIKSLIAPVVKTGIPVGTDASEIKYAMGWGVNYINGNIDITEHTGETCNYHAHAIIKNQEKIGIIELDNVGGFITAGQIATGVLKIVLGEQPSTSDSLRNFILIFNTIYLIIGILLLFSIIRLKILKKRLRKSKFRFSINLIFTILVNLILPTVVLLNASILLGASWKAAIFFSPDVSLVLIGSQVVLFIVGILKVAMIISVIKNKKQQNSEDQDLQG
jgi:CubicO group peptidase (beta-lactamase class C family)